MAMSDEYRAAQHYKPGVKKKKKSFAESFIPLKGDEPKVIISKLVTIALILVIVVCGVFLGRELYERHEAQKLNDRFISMRPEGDVFGNEQAGRGGESRAQREAPEERKPLVLLDSALPYLEKNPDYAGWIQIPNVFMEPIVQTDNNEYYIDYNFYGQKRSVGTVFADFRNVVNDYEESDNIILYGHNNKDGSMFGNMDYYLYDKRYWLKNPFIYLETKYERNIYVIIASFVTNTEPEHDNGNVFDYQNFIDFSASGDYTFEKFITEVNIRNQIITGIDADENDKFLTLSTCQYYWEPSRHIIVARKLRPGETTENIDTTKFEINPSPQWPEIYYRYGGS
ncbi:MAG: class B sortase [Oscillospiraceae bacterium]|nr:class B sortase [Oscillospiraceae bacterium]